MTIPDDIAKVAREVFDEIQSSTTFDSSSDYPGIEWEAKAGVEAIARAILAERERCANLALAQKRNLAALLTDPPMSAAANWIESQIRSGRAP